MNYPSLPLQNAQAVPNPSSHTPQVLLPCVNTSLAEPTPRFYKQRGHGPKPPLGMILVWGGFGEEKMREKRGWRNEGKGSEGGEMLDQ